MNTHESPQRRIRSDYAKITDSVRATRGEEAGASSYFLYCPNINSMSRFSQAKVDKD